MPPVTFVAATFGAYGRLFQCSQSDYQQAMSWASAAAKRLDHVLVHQNWLTLINMLSLVRTLAGSFTASMMIQRLTRHCLVPGTSYSRLDAISGTQIQPDSGERLTLCKHCSPA